MSFNQLISQFKITFLRWTDGSFTELNSEVVETECEDFWKEIYKIQKQFNNLIKKRKLELQAKLSEKKKSKSITLFYESPKNALL